MNVTIDDVPQRVTTRRCAPGSCCATARSCTTRSSSPSAAAGGSWSGTGSRPSTAAPRLTRPAPGDNEDWPPLPAAPRCDREPGPPLPGGGLRGTADTWRRAAPTARSRRGPPSTTSACAVDAYPPEPGPVVVVVVVHEQRRRGVRGDVVEPAQLRRRLRLGVDRGDDGVAVEREADRHDVGLAVAVADVARLARRRCATEALRIEVGVHRCGSYRLGRGSCCGPAADGRGELANGGRQDRPAHRGTPARRPCR